LCPEKSVTETFEDCPVVMPAVANREGYLLKLLLFAFALLMTGCNHYSPVGSVCEPSPLSGEDCKKSQPVGNYLLDQYREWQRYQ